MNRRGYLITPLLSPALVTGARVLFTALLCALSVHANAWIAIAHGDDGAAFVESNSDSSEQATHNALEWCRKDSQRCRLLGKPVAGPIALVVVRADGGITASTSRDPLSATERAMKDCKVRFKRPCKLDLVSWDAGDRWYAVAMGNGGAFVEYGDESVSVAKSGALQGCRKRAEKPETCEVQVVDSNPTWIAIAESAMTSAWATKSTKDAALAAARAACEQKNGGKPCGDTNVVFNPGPIDAPSSVATLQASIDREHKAATAPVDADTVVRYSDSCHNADCIRKYENGKTIRYTACLNPATSLPMNDPARLGGCGGTDSRGNAFGMGSF